MLRKNAKDYRVRRPPNTAAGRALHAVAAFFGAIARAILRRRNAEAVRNFDVGSVLETFLREGENIRYSSTVEAERARDARTRATVVDEDGTEVAYHERGGRRSAELDSVPKHDGIGEDVLDALDVMLRTEGDTTVYTREYGDVLLAFGRFRNQVPGLKGNGFLHVLEERTSKDGLSTPEAVEVFLKAVEAAVRGKENKALRSSNRHAIELNGYRAIVADNGDFREFITGYKIFTDEEKKKRSGVETDAIRRSEDYNPAFYDRLRQEGAERLKERIAQLLAERQVPKSVEELEEELEDLDIAHYRLLNARKKAEENGASQEELDALQKDIDDNRAKYKQVAKAKKKLNQQRAKERKLYGDPNEERRDHIKVWSGAPQEYDHPDILFIGSGTGGQNEGYGLYASGVLGVARDKYARAYIPKNPKTWAQLPVNGDRRYKTLGEFGKKCKTWAMKGALNPEENINIYFAALANDAVSGKIPKGNVKETLKKAILEELEREGKAAEDFVAWGRAVMNHEQVEPKTRRQEMTEAREAQLYKTYLALGFNQESVLDEQLNALLDVPVNRPAVMEQTWFTNRPEGDVSHLLSWFEPVTDEQRKWVEEAFDKQFADFDGHDYWKERIFKPGIIGKDFYKELHDLFLNIAHRSGMPTTDWVVQGHLVKFLLDADIDGTRYPVDYRHGHMKGELGWNYVAFSDEHLRVDHVYEYNPETDDFERKWHETRGAGSRFTETPLGQELVAHAFDVLIGVDADLLLRPWHYGEKREPGKGLVTAGLGRELDMTEEKGFAAEVSARISRFGTREGDPTLREIRARCGSKERFYEVLGAVFEAAVGLKLGVQDVITQREFGTMEKRMPLYAWVIRHNAQARATALGRKAYIMGRAFAERLHKEALAEARAEVERQRAKASEARAQTREAKAQTRNAERREETARHKRMRAEFSAAEADFIARWKLAEERAISRMRRTCNKSECIKGRKGPVKGS